MNLQTEESLESSVKKAMIALLRDPVQQIIEREALGQEPGECQATDEKVLESFAKLSSIVNSLEIPLEVLKSGGRSGSSISVKTRGTGLEEKEQERSEGVRAGQQTASLCPVTGCQFTILKDNPQSKALAANHLKVKE